MDKEIKRTTWSRFIKTFNTANQYRPTRISIKRRGDHVSHFEVTPFMGIDLSKKGRLVDGVQFYSGRWNPDTVAEPILTIDEPTQMWLEQDNNNRDSRLRIRSKDGTEVLVELHGDKQTEQAHALVEKVAYAMYEHRGFTPGNDWSDWFEAESRVREAELELTK